MDILTFGSRRPTWPKPRTWSPVHLAGMHPTGFVSISWFKGIPSVRGPYFENNADGSDFCSCKLVEKTTWWPQPWKLPILHQEPQCLTARRPLAPLVCWKRSISEVPKPPLEAEGNPAFNFKSWARKQVLRTCSGTFGADLAEPGTGRAKTLRKENRVSLKGKLAGSAHVPPKPAESRLNNVHVYPTQGSADAGRICRRVHPAVRAYASTETKSGGWTWR